MEKKQTPIWFWIVAVIILLWNLMGIYNFIMQMQLTAETIASLPEPEQIFINESNLFIKSAFGLAVFAGTIGSLLLLMKHAKAKLLFILSLVGIFVQSLFNFSIAQGIPGYTLIIGLWFVVLTGMCALSIWMTSYSNKNLINA